MKVITELFNRGDIVRADSLKPPSQNAGGSSYSLSTIRTTLSSYIFGSNAEAAPSLDDPIVPVAALKAAAERASSLSGPMASADIHTVKTFATAITNDNVRDAEAVIAHIVQKGDASVLFTDVTKENPEPILGVKLGKTKPVSGDKGVLHTKAALDRMEEMASHLETSVESEKQAAMHAAKSGNKAEALTKLRKKKVLETKLASARAAGAKLSEVLMAVDEAESNREAVVALETGMASLKSVTADGVTADRIDSVAADFDELIGDQQDVRVAFEQLNMDAMGNDAVLEAELEDLVNEADNLSTQVQEGAKEGKEGGVPVPTPVSKLTDEAEEELAKMLAGLPTPTLPQEVEAEDEGEEAEGGKRLATGTGSTEVGL